MLGRFLSELLALGRRDWARDAAARRFAAALGATRSLIEARRLEEAAAAVTSLLAQGPPSPEVHYLAGEVARKRGDPEAALASYRDALQLDNANADAWFGMGLCCFRAGDLHLAHLYLRTAHSIRPRDADILNELGLVEHAFGNGSLAKETFEKAVNANPEHPEAWSNLGMLHAAEGRVRDAKRAFLRAVSIRPAFYTALCNLGLACRQLEQADEAEGHLRAAIAVDGEPPDAWVALGSLLHDLDRLDEARAACMQARRGSAAGAAALVVLAGVLYRQGDLRGAESEYRAALEREPANAEAELGLAHLLIAQGRYAEGWDRYEARLRASASPARPFPYPACDGALTGRRVLIYGEQGVGDEILFASCLRDAMQDAQRCTYAPNPRLEGLMRRSFPGLALVRDDEAMRAGPGAAALEAQCCVPIGSLPRRYRRSGERFAPRRAYLAADPGRVARWRERVASLGARRALGVAWRGGHFTTGRVQRSIALAQLAPLLSLGETAWVSLQADARPEEAEEAARASGARVHLWRDAHGDLEETAALLCALDGAVAVASTIVHLGGALGRPVWVLAPVVANWRYGSEGDAMPWYPSVRVFRRGAGEDWEGPVARLAEALRA